MINIPATLHTTVTVTDQALYEAVEDRVYEKFNRKFGSGVKPRDRSDRLRYDPIFNDRLLRIVDYGHHRRDDQESQLSREEAEWMVPRLKMLELLKETLHLTD